MTNEQILKKAIGKAVKNGYERTYSTLFPTTNAIFTSEPLPISYCHIIFSHDFAEAFWGIDESSYWGLKLIKNEVRKLPTLTLWQLHLQTMVLEKEPLKYLEKFL